MKNKFFSLILLFCVLGLNAMQSQTLRKYFAERPYLQDKRLAAQLMMKKNLEQMKKNLDQLSENSVLICQKNTSKCIPVEKDVAQLSETIKEMLSDSTRSISIPYDSKKAKFVLDLAKECESVNKLAQDQQKKEWKVITDKLTALPLEQLIDICNCAFFLKFEDSTMDTREQNKNGEKKVDIFAQALLLKIRDLKYKISNLNYALADMARWGSYTPNRYTFSSLQEHEDKFNKLADWAILNRIDQENLKRGSERIYGDIFDKSDNITDLLSVQKDFDDGKSRFKNLLNNFIPVCQEGTSNCVRIYKDMLMLSNTIKDPLEAQGFDEKSLETISPDQIPPIMIPHDIAGSAENIYFVFDFANKCNHETIAPTVAFESLWPRLKKILMKLPLKKLIEASRCAFYLGFECCEIKNSGKNMMGKEEINIFSEALLGSVLKYRQKIDELYAALDDLLKNGLIPGAGWRYEEDLDKLEKYEQQLNNLPDYSILNLINKDVLVLASQELYKQLFPSAQDNLLSFQRYLNTKKAECKSLILKCKNKNKWFYQRWLGW